MPPRARGAKVCLLAALLVSCTNDYGEFRYLRTPKGSGGSAVENDASGTGGSPESGGSQGAGGSQSSGGSKATGGSEGSGGSPGPGGPDGEAPDAEPPKADASAIADAAFDVTND